MRELWDVYDRYGNVIQGRVAVRGRHDLRYGEYHLVVYVWIITKEGQIVLSRRQKGKTFAGTWQCTSGCAQRGEDSLTAAIREVKEELGLRLNPSNGVFYKRYPRNFPKGAMALCDVWCFREDVTIEEIFPQKEEVSDVRIVSREQLEQMLQDGEFHKRVPYLAEMIKHCFSE